MTLTLRFPAEDNRTAFYILKVDDAKYSMFKRRMNEPKPITLSDYGEILYSGWGEPSDTIKSELRDKYGMYES